MNPEHPAIALSPGDGKPDGLDRRKKRRIPLIAKIAGTAFLAVLVPIYLHTYGPTNFLWFCDAALIVTVAGMWLESSLLISICAVGILVPQFFWLVDFGAHLLGMHMLGLTGYMFDRHLPLFTRGLSLFHGWLPLVLIWLLRRLKYDQRALYAWTMLAGALVMGSYVFALPAGAHPVNANIPVNIDYVYGFNDRQPQTWVNQNFYVVLWLIVLWLIVFLPTHLALRRFISASQPVDGAQPSIRLP